MSELIILDLPQAKRSELGPYQRSCIEALAKSIGFPRVPLIQPTFCKLPETRQ